MDLVPPSNEFAILRARLAQLETHLKVVETQAGQIEALRRLGSWEVDLITSTLIWSAGTYRIFGLSPDEPLTVEKALSFYPDDSRAAIATSLEAAIAIGTPWDLTVQFTNSAGECGWIRTVGQMEVADGGRRVVGVVEDVTAEKSVQDRLRQLAFCDALTGLPNRRAFELRLTKAEMDARGGTATALFLIDVDGFKHINDTFGHPGGDQLLQELAVRLQRSVRPSDFVARVGGDEFGIILDGISDPSVLEQKAFAILCAIRKKFPIESGVINPTVSIGIAHTTLPGGRNGLFKCADMALYRSKSLGRDQAKVYEGSLRCRADDDADTIEGVRRAIAEDRLVVYYQPIVDLRTGHVRGLEALVRWDHPELGVLPPGRFEAAFADPILSVAIDDFVLRRSLQQMRTWLDQGVPAAVVNVNMSDAQVRRRDLVDRIVELLAMFELEPSHLKVELVETAFLGKDTSQVAATIERLANLGVVCALDDFGTGYASLVHLKKFRVERIKIDRSFIENICTDAFDRGLTKSMIALGQNLGIRVTAEGVETDEQLALLQQFGCDCAQGYLIGRPSAAEDIPGIIDRWHARQTVIRPARAGPATVRDPRGSRAPVANFINLSA